MLCEVLQIFLQLFYGLLLTFLGLFVVYKNRNIKIHRETPDLLYLFFRHQVKKFLVSHLPKLKLSISDLICKELDLPFFAEEKESDEIQAAENEIFRHISSFWTELRQSIPKDREDRQDDLVKALVFEMDSSLIKNPHDLLGRRRAYRLKALLMNVINKTEMTKEHSWFKLISVKVKLILKKVPGIENCLHGKIVSFLFVLQTAGLSVVVHCYDYITDAEVIREYYNIAFGGEIKSMWTWSNIVSSEGLGGLPKVNRFTDLVNATTDELEDGALMNTHGMIGFLSFLLLCVIVVSLILLLPTLPTLHSLCTIPKQMISSETERLNFVDQTKALNRYNFARSESGTESIMQLTFQMSIYLVITWTLTWMNKEVFPIKEYSSFSMSILWKSFVMSILSITGGQLKSRMVLHEYSTDFSKVVFYWLACFFNTVFGALIWIPLVVAVFDCINGGGLELSAWEGDPLPFTEPRSKMLSLGFFLSLLLVILIPTCVRVLRLPTSDPADDISSWQSERFLSRMKNQILMVAFLVLFTGFLNLAILAFTQSTVSPILLDFASRFPNYTTPEPIYGFETAFLTPSTVTKDNARQNFIILSSVLLPLSLVGSYLMLFFYFKDNVSDMKFTKKPRKERSVMCQLKTSLLRCCVDLSTDDDFFWEDLAVLDKVEVDEHVLNKNPFLLDKEKFDQEVFNSVLESLPLWKEKTTIESTRHKMQTN